jgi:hypothetical protein
LVSSAQPVSALPRRPAQSNRIEVKNHPRSLNDRELPISLSLEILVIPKSEMGILTYHKISYNTRRKAREFWYQDLTQVIAVTMASYEYAISFEVIGISHQKGILTM